MGLIFSPLNPPEHKTKVSKAFALRSYFGNDNCSAVLQTPLLLTCPLLPGISLS